MAVDAMKVTIDFETRSYADLKKVGTWSYSQHATTQVICLCYAIDDGPIFGWWPGSATVDVIPLDLKQAIEAGAEIEAHNVAFEISIWLNIMVARYSWPEPKLEQWRDSMAVASYYALPAALDRLAHALGFPGKDAEGGRLITKYCKLHLKTAKPEIPPEDFAKFVAYCTRDVELERSISTFLGELPERELPIFQLDLETNLRGLYLDLEGIAAATDVVDARADDLATEFVGITGLNPTQGAKLIVWFQEQGITLENMQADYLQDLLDDGDIPAGPARRALQIRLEINKASTKKLDAMARNAGDDGRARFQTRYHGAATGRGTGSGFQPLNLNRGFEDMDPDCLTRDIMLRDPTWLDACYGDAMDAVSKASRYWIKAAPGKIIRAGDFASIEAVVLSCLAGEHWKTEAFRNKAKIYELTADKIYGYPPGTVKKGMEERQDGKRCELAFGYQGSLGAWLKFDPKPIHSDAKILGFNRAWRKEHPATRDFWRNLEEAAINAVDHPGKAFGVEPSGIEFEVIDHWLTIRLPNGKRLWYFQPQLRASMPQWHKPAVSLIPDPDYEGEDEAPLIPNPCHYGECSCRPRAQVTYMATKEGQWKRVSTYGGKLAENVTQATSREILKAAERRVKAAGYHQILGVYDEIVCEEDLDFGSTKELASVMEQTEPWFASWPIRVDPMEGTRYHK